MMYCPPTNPSGSLATRSSTRGPATGTVAATTSANRAVAMSACRVDLVDEVVHLVEVPVEAGQRLDLVPQVQLDLPGQHHQRAVIGELGVVGPRRRHLGVQVGQRAGVEALQ